MKTPIVLLIFNRPDTTERVFAEIARARPSKLFVVADGPRPDRPEDAEKCAAARKIVERVNWDCEVLKNYSDVNIGCASRPPTGISWVFEQVEEAIILEDDCVPHPTFFRFCQELLENYRDDPQVMMIGGFNSFERSTPYSYYFCFNHSNWGWATWRRAWQYYDFEIRLWPALRETNWLQDILGNFRGVEHWRNIFDLTYASNRNVDTWDYQWTFACWARRGLAIKPKVNLIRNIGFGENATHTKSAKNRAANVLAREVLFPLCHPPSVVRNEEYDKFVFESLWPPSKQRGSYWRFRQYLSLVGPASLYKHIASLRSKLRQEN
jgi:hypothetical protein